VLQSEFTGMSGFQPDVKFDSLQDFLKAVFHEQAIARGLGLLVVNGFSGGPEVRWPRSDAADGLE
jgi:hypothetical protein